MLWLLLRIYLFVEEYLSERAGRFDGVSVEKW